MQEILDDNLEKTDHANESQHVEKEVANSNFQNDIQAPVPNADLVLVFGILSIVGCCCYGIPGIIFGVISLVFAKKASDQYAANPQGYQASSMSSVNTGRICAIVGLIPSILYLLLIILMIMIFGFTALIDPGYWSNYSQNNFY
ncbi:hypothetical protein AwDysgo_03720 [Bacteroidales bacterium]|nr:hypothetical protein AwDysgo_03720 [Bacteroidales bacterium]